MPVTDLQTTGPELSATEIAGGLVKKLRDPLENSALIRDLNNLLTPSGLMVAHRLLTADDLALRLGVTRTEAKDFLNTHGDVQAGRWWRMSESRYSECVKAGRFRRK